MLKTGKIDYVACHEVIDGQDGVNLTFTHMINELRGKGLNDPLISDEQYVLYSNYGPIWSGLGPGTDYKSACKYILYLPGTHRDRDEEQVRIPAKHWTGVSNLISKLNSMYRDSYKSGRYIQPGVQVGPEAYQFVEGDYTDMAMRIMVQLYDNYSMSVNTQVQIPKPAEHIELNLVLGVEPRPLTEVLREIT